MSLHLLLLARSARFRSLKAPAFARSHTLVHALASHIRILIPFTRTYMRPHIHSLEHFHPHSHTLKLAMP